MNATPFPGLTPVSNPFTGRSALRNMPAVTSEPWTFDDGGEPLEVSKPKHVEQPKVGGAFSAEDYKLVRFLCRHRIADTRTLARLMDRTPESMQARLGVLARRKWVQGVPGWGSRARDLWAANGSAAYTVTDVELKPFNLDSISKVLLAHTLQVSAVAAELEREAEDSSDVLALRSRGETFPARNRMSLKAWATGVAARTWGENTVSENELKRADGYARAGAEFSDLRYEVHQAANLRTGQAPELDDVHLFVVYGDGGGAGFHIPDLIIARPRGEHGEPRSIAVEVELTGKSEHAWRRILRAYRDYGEMFSQVVYLTDSAAVARGVMKADEAVGLFASGRLVINRLTTPDATK